MVMALVEEHQTIILKVLSSNTGTTVFSIPSSLKSQLETLSLPDDNNGIGIGSLAI